LIPGTVRGKIIYNSAVILAVMGLATLYNSLASAELARSVDVLFRNNLRMQNLGHDLSLTEESLAAYLRTKSSDALKEYIMHSTRLAEGARGLNREIRAEESLLLQRDLAALVERYLGDTEASVKAKRGRDVQAYADFYESSERTATLVRYIISRIEDIFMADSLRAYSAFNSRIPLVLTLNALLVLAAALTGFMLLVRFSFRLTDPLSRLAQAARAVGRGEHLTDLSLPMTDDEIGTMTAAFIAMQSSIHRAFEELKAKAEIERRLMEERMRVLDMGHRLKDAELLALQTQINPHFLFNTLSAGMQLALAENADRSAEFMDNLAAFIRYALKTPSRWVRVADEIECINRYIWLLRLRFGERYRFSISVDTECLACETPSLVLQPLVENSVSHGLRDREEGGEIKISVALRGGELAMEVSDTGDGMERAEIERIRREATGDDVLQDGGIGLRNVIRRVILSSNGGGAVDIESEPGRYTLVRIRLPAANGAEA
jgi:sensor histidine kinase YesM